ncbi:MAG: TetR/AcrR family transcriptional regulator [Desulfobacterales bacterium]|nr:MAG: TetR/AcrR family transcriptional regulator [Desulfobacterales bacterium]
MGRKSNAPKRREQIVWALYDCLAEKGHEKVTIKEIAAQANLPPGVIHYYFKSKDEIVSILAEAIIEKYSKILDLRVDEASSSEQRIDLIINFLVDLIFDRPLNRVFYNLIQMAFEREQLHQVMKTMLKDYREKLAEVFIEAGAGQYSPLLGAALVAVTEGFSVQLMVDPKAIKRADVDKFITQAVRDRLMAAERSRKTA